MNEIVEKGKTAAITSYILLIGALIALSMNAEEKNPFAAFHIRQSLGLSLLFISLGLLVSPFDNWMITAPMYFFVAILWTYGLVTALKGEMIPVPIFGKFFQKFLRKF
ncbi:hypothetical protein HUK80_00340 [Flavobacterium sp. MAH-1]|uniref:Chloroplast import component protein (Tic20) n=1 Tax=Flavobacterium agri TaxID=2743471 RepID=A0A7Y9C4I3_9FLAO|nr:hypothetical protein [Flavobacterium agri]NUY79325.1 hypothetical protein [Flavobacterium agri]NYA69349.1 hypothetical protein [Flavobacterium agri]